MKKKQGHRHIKVKARKVQVYKDIGIQRYRYVKIQAADKLGIDTVAENLSIGKTNRKKVNKSGKSIAVKDLDLGIGRIDAKKADKSQVQAKQIQRKWKTQTQI